MSKELLSKNTTGVLSAVLRQPHWGKEELLKSLQKVLGQIKESTSSTEEYLESLLGNVTFQYANTNAAMSFLKKCVDEEKFFTQESFQAVMVNLPNQVIESNFIAENKSRFKELVYKGTTEAEQVSNAERVFSHTKIVNDMLVEFIGTFLQEKNREFMTNFMQYSSQVVAETLMQNSQAYSNLMLGELNKVELEK